MTLNIVSSFNGVSDPDAAAYIEAVEAADGQLLEFGVGKAINDFVVGCKLDGIWDAIKASCILAGARTKEGAFIDLKTATQILTNNGFADGDYNRVTGLVGDGSTKYLDSNRNNNADPQDNKHIAVQISSAETTSSCSYFGAGVTEIGASTHFASATYGHYFSVNSPLVQLGSSISNTGLVGCARSTSTQLIYKTGSASSLGTANKTSVSPRNENIKIFRRGNTAPSYTNARIAFYSIGESLDLAKLDTRVSNLMTAIGAAIP